MAAASTVMLRLDSQESEYCFGELHTPKASSAFQCVLLSTFTRHGRPAEEHCGQSLVQQGFKTIKSGLTEMLS